VDDILRRALVPEVLGLQDARVPTEPSGLRELDKVIVIDQTPLAVPRAATQPPTPACSITSATSSPAFPAAKIRGYGSDASASTSKAAAARMQGDGLIKIEMPFLPPVYVTCEACNGRRYNTRTWKINLQGPEHPTCWI